MATDRAKITIAIKYEVALVEFWLEYLDMTLIY